jgi:hypothetical protein
MTGRLAWRPRGLSVLCISLLLSASILACDPSDAAAQARSDSGAALLPRAAYLLALDSSLSRVRHGAPRVWVSDLEPFPFTAQDMESRQALRGNGDATCPGEASVSFDTPTRRPDGRISLHVVEKTPVPPGWTLGHLYMFRCADGACRLEGDGQLEEDFVRTCGPGVEFGSDAKQPSVTR